MSNSQKRSNKDLIREFRENMDRIENAVGNLFHVTSESSNAVVKRIGEKAFKPSKALAQFRKG